MKVVTVLICILVGLSFAFIIPCLLLANNIDIITRPWNEIRSVWIRRVALKFIDILHYFKSVDRIRRFGYRWESRLVFQLLDDGVASDLKPNVEKVIENTLVNRWGIVEREARGQALMLHVDHQSTIGDYSKGIANLVENPKRIFEGYDSDQELSPEDEEKLEDDADRLKKLIWARLFGQVHA